MEKITLNDFKIGEYYRIDLQDEGKTGYIFCQLYCVSKVEAANDSIEILTVLPIGRKKTVNLLLEMITGFVHLIMDETGFVQKQQVNIPALSKYGVHKGDGIKEIFRRCEKNWHSFNNEDKEYIFEKIKNVMTVNDYIFLFDEIMKFKNLFSQMHNKYMELLNWKIDFISEYVKSKRELPQFIVNLCDSIIYGRCGLNKKVKRSGN